MIKSMTGYGKAESELNHKKVTVEIKTLNSKQLDLNTRMPSVYRAKELEIRNLLSQELERGKIELNIQLEQTGQDSNFSINKTLARKYYDQLKGLADDLDQSDFTNFLPIILKMPDVLKADKEDLDESEWNELEKIIKDAIVQVDEFRLQEGTHLQKEITDRIHTVVNLLAEVEPFETARIDQIKARIQKNLDNLQTELNIDQNRFEQELIYYIEKIDITEEKVRLKQHCDYFLETIVGDGSLGKKLGFISQEIGREINTLGSKANEVNMQKIVIQMKDELEKIKEQLFNIL
ncbi:MAG: YicC family protein [Bacteroidetes bacterium]|nr:YicC family protein [Bacteroidota bacterium]